MSAAAPAVDSRRSPRTPEVPMAFTAGEFWRGAGLAVIWFVVLTIPASVIAGIGMGLSSEGSYGAGGTAGAMASAVGTLLMMAPLISAPWAIGAFAVFTPVAYALGRGMRRVPELSHHALAFSGLGVLVSVVTTLALSILFPLGALAIPYALAAAVAVFLGWWRTARTALRTDAARAAL